MLTAAATSVVVASATTKKKSEEEHTINSVLLPLNCKYHQTYEIPQS